MVAPITAPPRFEGPPSVIGCEAQAGLRPVHDGPVSRPRLQVLRPESRRQPSAPLRPLLRRRHEAQSTTTTRFFPIGYHHWPRLLYHRHFMLTEFINDFAPPEVWRGDPPDAPNAGCHWRLPPVLRHRRCPAVRSSDVAMLHPSPARNNPKSSSPSRRSRTPRPAARARVRRRHRSLPGQASRRDARRFVSIANTCCRRSEDFHRVGGRLDSPESYLDRLITSYTAEQKS